MSLSEEILRAIKKESLYLINEDAIRLTEWADKAAELEHDLQFANGGWEKETTELQAEVERLQKIIDSLEENCGYE